MTNEEIQIRTAMPDDLSFIYSTWLRSYRHASQFAKRMTNEIFYEMHHKVIDRFIERGGQIFIAHPKGDSETILGYLCADTAMPVIQYVYVKKSFRKMGIATALHKNASAAIMFSHWTNDTDWIVKKLKNLIYNPYLL